MRIPPIPRCEALRYMACPPEAGDEIRESLDAICADVRSSIEARVVLRRFPLGQDGAFCGAGFTPRGDAAAKLLSSCHEGLLMAVTLGAESERMILRAQAKGAWHALMVDAVLSAAVESVCDETERAQRAQLESEGLYLTSRISPGYADMPLEQSAQILGALDAQRAIGLTLSKSGLMIPRKSVTAVMGISRQRAALRPSGCAACSYAARCTMRKEGK